MKGSALLDGLQACARAFVSCLRAAPRPRSTLRPGGEATLGSGDANSLAGAVAAVESCVGLYARAFAAATVEPMNARTRALTPAVLSSIARRLIRRGESCHLIDVDRGQVRLIEASFWDVQGAARRPWHYRLTLTGPSTTQTVWVPDEAVLHCLYSSSELVPWRGVSPMAWSPTTARLVERLERSVADEVSTPVGQLLTLPEGHGEEVPEGETDPIADLRSDLAKLRGGLAMLETTAGGWGDKGGAPAVDWKPRRIGPDVPASSVELRAAAAMSVFQACGVPVALLIDADGTAQRESFRRWLHTGRRPARAARRGRAARQARRARPGAQLRGSARCRRGLEGPRVAVSRREGCDDG